MPRSSGWPRTTPGERPPAAERASSPPPIRRLHGQRRSRRSLPRSPAVAPSRLLQALVSRRLEAYRLKTAWPDANGSMKTSAAARALAAITVAATGLAGGGSAGHAQARAPNPIQAENQLPGSEGWIPSANVGIEAYGSEAGARPGESLHLHVSTAPAAHYRIEIYRLGWYGSAGGHLVTCLPTDCGGAENGQPGPPPSIDPSTGETRAQRPVTDTLAIGGDWVSGYYVAKALLTDGPEVGNAASVPFVVEASASRPSAILVVAAENTWQAYNNWGGRSLYAFNSANRPAATHVSFDRPYGVSAQTPFQWEYQAVRFLESRGYDVSYATDAEIDANPNELLRHRLVIVNGHNEYWTKAMRDGFDAARTATGRSATRTSAGRSSSTDRALKTTKF